MDAERDERIRARAHRIWEVEGRPEGREDEHWGVASREIDAEEAAGSRPAGGAAGEEPDGQTRISPADAVLGVGMAANR